MLDYSRRKLRSQNFINQLARKITGSTKEPCFRFWANSLVLAVFIFLILNLALISWENKGDNIYLASVSAAFNQHEEKDLFINPLSGFSPEMPEILLVENSFVKAASPLTFFSPQLLGVSVDDYQETIETRTEIIEHSVESEETLSLIAEKYNISLNTLLWANSLTKTSKLKTGQKLIVLPVSGTVHHVKSGDNISSIAQKHKTKSTEIISFNNLSNEDDIFIGDILIVPNGTMPAPTIQRKSSSVAVGSAPSTIPVGSSYFIAPVPSPYIITQRLHWYNAIDLAHQGYSCGKPVFAAAEGTVQRTGYHNVAGNYIRILHSNGVVTSYGHLATMAPNIKSGVSVSQGDIIGYIGNTGYTIGVTGCHLHFEVRGAANPFAR